VARAFARNVFINCAFDTQFQPIFYAIVFATIRSGFRARCALETEDGAENRFANIQNIVEQCRYGIHDLSRTESGGNPPLPRFNMPLELGLFLGAKRYGNQEQKRKRILILDSEQYRYQRFISDIAGQDIRAHGSEQARAIEMVATWLRVQSRSTGAPGGRRIAREFAEFQRHLPAILEKRQFVEAEVTFGDYVTIVTEWITESLALATP
jgi:hypothetical protein